MIKMPPMKKEIDAYITNGWFAGNNMKQEKARVYLCC